MHLLPAAAEVASASLLADVAYSINDVATSLGCPRAMALAVAFYNGLTIAAPTAAAPFAAAISTQVRCATDCVYFGEIVELCMPGVLCCRLMCSE